MTDYRGLGLAEKQAYAREGWREQGVRCPACETECGVADLLAHVEQRCEGPRPAPRGARWLTAAQARSLVSGATLSRFVASGLVRVRGDALTRNSACMREYLQRDLVLALAWRWRLSRARPWFAGGQR